MSCSIEGDKSLTFYEVIESYFLSNCFIDILLSAFRGTSLYSSLFLSTRHSTFLYVSMGELALFIAG